MTRKRRGLENISHIGTLVAIILKKHSPADREKGKANYGSTLADLGHLGNTRSGGWGTSEACREEWKRAWGSYHFDKIKLKAFSKTETSQAGIPTLGAIMTEPAGVNGEQVSATPCCSPGVCPRRCQKIWQQGAAHPHLVLPRSLFDCDAASLVEAAFCGNGGQRLSTAG